MGDHPGVHVELRHLGPNEPAAEAGSVRAAAPPPGMTGPTRTGRESGRRGRINWGPVPARARIAAAMVGLLVMVQVAVTVGTRGVLLTELDQDIAASLQQEVEEFEQFARVGSNPRTGAAFTGAEELLDVHLDRQRPDESQVMAGVVAAGDRPRGTVDVDLEVTAIVGQRDAARALEQPGVLGAVVAAVAVAPVAGGPVGGIVMTGRGELRWSAVTVRVGTTGAPGLFVAAYLVEPERAEVDFAVTTLVLISGIGLVGAGVVAWLVAGIVLGPVRLVRQTAAQITEQDLSRRIPVRGRDDIAALAHQFNAMLDRLAVAFATQREFLDDVAHELRTPITIIGTTLDVLDADPVRRDEEVRLCRDELDRMGRIVADLLVLATAERPDFVRTRPVELAGLTDDLYDKVRAMGDRDWRLERLGEGVVLVDPQRVTQAVLALADNAVQHTGPGTEIRLGSECARGRVQVWVTDRGPGVPAADRDRLFLRFVRGSGATRRRRGGAGLGLSIVMAIAKAHGGTVTVGSPPGVGATFTLDLPSTGQPRR